MVSSEEKLGFDRSLLSMLMDATSLTMIPTLRPSLLVSRFWRVVVFPEPRNPARSVIGTYPASASASVSSFLVSESEPPPAVLVENNLLL